MHTTYRDGKKGMYILLSNSCLVLPAVVKQQQQDISRNHVPSLFAVSVHSLAAACEKGFAICFLKFCLGGSQVLRYNAALLPARGNLSTKPFSASYRPRLLLTIHTYILLFVLGRSGGGGLSFDRYPSLSGREGQSGGEWQMCRFQS